QMRVAVAAVSFEVGDMLALRVSLASRGAADVTQDGRRRIDGAKTGGLGPEAIIHVVVGDLEFFLIKPVQLAIEIGASEQARARDGGDISRGVWQEKMAEV